MDEMNYIETEEGTPQGGIISPLLCNVALNGIEKAVMKTGIKRKGIGPGVHLIRYADDMIVMGKNKEILLKIKEVISQFLKERGLELNENKTKIIHIKEGFNFLGFNIRRLKYNPKLNNPTSQETVLVIKPSKKGIYKLKHNIRNKMDKSKPIEGLIRDMNPILRG
jgi:RNA-directed DNA polymerase